MSTDSVGLKAVLPSALAAELDRRTQTSPWAELAVNAIATASFCLAGQRLVEAARMVAS
jgi:hypothetical protein